MRATCIIAEGPESAGIDRYTGDEYAEYTVCAADDDGEPVGTIYRTRSRTVARRTAERMARDRRLELVDEMF